MISEKTKRKSLIARYPGSLLKAILSIWTDRKKIGRRKSKELTHQKSCLLIASRKLDQAKFKTQGKKVKMKEVEMRPIMKDRL